MKDSFLIDLLFLVSYTRLRLISHSFFVELTIKIFLIVNRL